MTDSRPRSDAPPAQSDGQTPDRKASLQGDTHVGSANGDVGRKPRVPPHRDESSDSQASATADHEKIGKVAYEDAAGPQQDTDRATVTDKVYNEEVVPPASRT